MSLLLAAGCIAALLVLAVLAVGLVVIILQSGPRDGVSTAREGWLTSRPPEEQ